MEAQRDREGPECEAPGTEGERMNGCERSRNGGEPLEIRYATDDYTAQTDVQVASYRCDSRLARLSCAHVTTRIAFSVCLGR